MSNFQNYFELGAARVKPYLQIVDTRAEDPNTENGRKDIEKGIAYLQNAVELEPYYWPAYWIIGKTYQATGNTEQAYRYFKKAFELESNHIDVCRELNLTCLELGQTVEALAIALVAVRIKPEDAGLLANLSLSYLLDGQLDEAEQTAKKALSLNPSDQITKDLLKFIYMVKSGNKPQPSRMADLTTK